MLFKIVTVLLAISVAFGGLMYFQNDYLSKKLNKSQIELTDALDELLQAKQTITALELLNKEKKAVEKELSDTETRIAKDANASDPAPPSYLAFLRSIGLYSD